MTYKTSPPLVGALLRRPFMAIRRQIHADLQARGFTELHPAHLSVFQHPGPHGRRPIELAEAAQMTKQAMNHLLGQLTELGFLERVSSGRVTTVKLTPRGHEVQQVMRESVARIEAHWRDALGAGAYQRLRELLLRLNEGLDGEAEDSG